MNFGQALEQVKKGKGMKLWYWLDGVSIRIWKPEIELEKVAEAVHNAWWEEKKKQGVTDHPDMLPYNQLSEEVKEYDRVTAKVTIGSINYMTSQFLYMEICANGKIERVPWHPSPNDLLSERWEIVD